MPDRSRRQFCAASMGVSASALFATPAFAQSGEQILGILGQLTEGKGSGAKAGRKPLDALQVIATILLLEKEAELKNLPASRLSLQPAANTRQTLPNDDGSIYSAGLPRLVNLIDQTESTPETGLGDQAGKVLADLNESERTHPEGLKPKATSRARDFVSLKDEYAALFADAQLRPERSDLAQWHAAALQQFRPRYEEVARATGVPWFFIGVVHGLEASYNFRAHLHNGDFPLSQRTRQVPAGRPRTWGPPFDWASSAIDALRLMEFAGAKDWTLERTLYRLEAYNGFGYRRLGVPTPYLWSFSNHYESGKFVADGSFNPRAKSQQCGAATTLKLLENVGVISFA